MDKALGLSRDEQVIVTFKLGLAMGSMVNQPYPLTEEKMDGMHKVMRKLEVLRGDSVLGSEFDHLEEWYEYHKALASGEPLCFEHLWMGLLARER